MGPLPQLHTVLVVGLALVVSLIGGLWLAARLELPLDGIGVGIGAGCLLGFLLTHDFSPRARRR